MPFSMLAGGTVCPDKSTGGTLPSIAMRDVLRIVC